MERSNPIVTILIVILALIAAAVIVALVNYLARVAPFGAIYTENGQLVVRLRDVVRPPLQNLMFRNRVSGDELGITGFESVSFRFYRDEVLIEALEVAANTVRLNNQPITELTVVHDGSWLGAMGRLYTFSYSEPTGGTPVAEDDSAEAEEDGDSGAEGSEARA